MDLEAPEFGKQISPGKISPVGNSDLSIIHLGGSKGHSERNKEHAAGFPMEQNQ